MRPRWALISKTIIVKMGTQPEFALSIAHVASIANWNEKRGQCFCRGGSRTAPTEKASSRNRKSSIMKSIIVRRGA
jgi:hypothetical protein